MGRSRAVRLALSDFTLDNGLRVVVQPDPALPLVAVNLWYHVGSKNERPGRTGLAHLFEHMLFQGSRHVGTNDHFRYVQQVGGVANGSTWYDRTNYYETLPAGCLDLGLWLESDRMGFLLPALTQEKLDTQREVVINERLQRVDNQPYGRAFERLHELLYPADHPYHWPVIGYVDDLRRADLGDLRDFFRTYYVPDNAVLTLAGDVRPEEALERVERYLGSIPRGGEIPRVTNAAPAPAGEIRETLPDAVELARVYLAYRTPPYGDPGWYAAAVLASLLAGAKSSPLYRDLVYERRLAQDVSAFVPPTELEGAFYVVATARHGVESAVLEEALGRHLQAAAEPPASSDLERVRNRTRTEFFDLLQTVERRADLLSQLTTYFGRPERVHSELDRYLSPGGPELAAFARRSLRRDARVVLTVEPAGGPG